MEYSARDSITEPHPHLMPRRKGYAEIEIEQQVTNITRENMKIRANSSIRTINSSCRFQHDQSTYGDTLNSW